MIKNKMTPTPWVAGGSFPYKGNEGYIFATSMRPEILVCKTFGSIDENIAPVLEQIENSKAIVSAVNNTYGAGINPETVPELVEALHLLMSFSEEHPKNKDTWWNRGAPSAEALSKAKAAIEKAKL
jgi:hypothetical protein